LPYVAITRPHLLTNAAGWIVRTGRAPAWLGAFAAYFIFCLVLAFLLRMVLAPLAWMLGALGGIAGLLAGANGRRPTATGAPQRVRLADVAAGGPAPASG
jgi:hypothetical protein